MLRRLADNLAMQAMQAMQAMGYGQNTPARRGRVHLDLQPGALFNAREV